MKTLGERNYELIRSGVRSVGSYDPSEIFCVFEERLKIGESEIIFEFLMWVNQDTERRSFGHGNYEQRFAEFKIDKGIVDEEEEKISAGLFFYQLDGESEGMGTSLINNNTTEKFSTFKEENHSIWCIDEYHIPCTPDQFEFLKGIFGTMDEDY